MPINAIKSYRDLLIWRKGMDLVVSSYRLANKLPQHENVGLISQIESPSVSIPANIAEGHGRRHTGDFLHHLSMARGSLVELETHFYICVRLSYLQSGDIQPLLKMTDELGRMISSLIQKLKKA